MLLSQFPLTLHQIYNGMPHFIACFMIILMLIGMTFVIIREMFHGRISLSLVLLLLLGNFVSGFRLELMYISLRNTRSSLTYLHGFHSAACAAVVAHRNHFFRLYQEDKSASKVKFRQASNRCKSVLEAVKLAYANKTKESVTFQKLGSRDIWQIANCVLNKGKSAIPPLFNGLEVLSSACDKAKLFAENFSKNSSLNDSGISLPHFSSRTNLKLHNISVSPKMVKKFKMNLDLSKASGPGFIPVVVFMNCEPELSFILAELFIKCLKESCFPDCWKFSSVVPVFKNVWERSTSTLC